MLGSSLWLLRVIRSISQIAVYIHVYICHVFYLTKTTVKGKHSYVRKPIGDISLSRLGRDCTLRRYILHLNDI